MFVHYQRLVIMIIELPKRKGKQERAHLEVAEGAKGDVVLQVVAWSGSSEKSFIPEKKRKWEKWIDEIITASGGVPWIQILPPYKPPQNLPFHSPKQAHHYLTHHCSVIQLRFLLLLPPP